MAGSRRTGAGGRTPAGPVFLHADPYEITKLRIFGDRAPPKLALRRRWGWRPIAPAPDTRTEGPACDGRRPRTAAPLGNYRSSRLGAAFAARSGRSSDSSSRSA